MVKIKCKCGKSEMEFVNLRPGSISEYEDACCSIKEEPKISKEAEGYFKLSNELYQADFEDEVIEKVEVEAPKKKRNRKKKSK